MSNALTKLHSSSASDAVREHARDTYLRPAQQRGLTTFSINVGQVHRALALENRVPLVCQALKSAKFLESNGLRLISETGPPSGQSTTVTYTFEFIGDKHEAPKRDPWTELRGALKEVFAESGGGERYLRAERESFERKESR
jgi:hypothetical protein